MMDFGDISNIPGLQELENLGIPDLSNLFNSGGDEYNTVQDMLLWAQDAAKMFEDPRFQSLESVLNSPGYTTFNDKKVESVNRELHGLANEYLSDNPAWATRTEWQQVWGPLFSIAPDANPFLYGDNERPTAVTGDSSKTTSVPVDDDDEVEKDVSAVLVDADAEETGSNETGSDDKTVSTTRSTGAMTGTGGSNGGSGPSPTATEGWNALTSADKNGSGSPSSDSSGSGSSADDKVSSTTASQSATVTSESESATAPGSAPDTSPTAASSSPQDNSGISNSVSLFGVALVFAAALI